MTERVLITRNKIDTLADSISIKSGVSTPMTLTEMKNAVDSISTGQGIIPTGTLTIVENGTYNVETYASANVNVPSSGEDIMLQTKTAIPSESVQTITADTGYDGLSSVEVGAISSTYVGSGIDQRSSNDLTVSGNTVSVPEGYYSEEAFKAIANGSASIPATTITTNPSISVNTTNGLITANVSGSKSVTPNISAGYISSGTAGVITVSGSNTSQLSTQAGVTIPPTESEQTAVIANKYTLGDIKIGAISSTYVGSKIDKNDSTDLTVSGATVTVPAGYYEENVNKSVDTGSTGTPSATKSTVSNHQVSITPSVTNTTGYITGGTKTGTAVSVAASELVSGTLTIDSSGTKDVTNYASASVAAGSATAPSSISGTAASVSTGTNSLTLSKTISVTPSVTAGYVSSGTAGNSSVSLTANVTTKVAATITPGTTDQTIVAGTYLTGAQTIAGDANLVSSNIISGTSIFGVNGSVAFQTIYSGSSDPTAATGVNGDIYIKVVS